MELLVSMLDILPLEKGFPQYSLVGSGNLASMGRTKYCKKVALKHSSKDCPRLVVNASICTIMKLKYLSRIIAGVDHDNVSQRVLSSLVDDVESFNIVRECKELEDTRLIYITCHRA